MIAKVVYNLVSIHLCLLILRFAGQQFIWLYVVPASAAQFFVQELGSGSQLKAPDQKKTGKKNIPAPMSRHVPFFRG